MSPGDTGARVTRNFARLRPTSGHAAPRATMRFVTRPSWLPDPEDPRAPPQDVWDRLSDEERELVVTSLPADMPFELHPPEGDEHRKPKERARDALDEFFRRIGRRVYVS